MSQPLQNVITAQDKLAKAMNDALNKFKEACPDATLDYVTVDHLPTEQGTATHIKVAVIAECDDGSTINRTI